MVGCVKLFWRKIYCASTRPEPDSQSGSRSWKGLGRRAPQSMCKYDCVTAVAISPLIHPLTWETGYSSSWPWVDSISWLWIGTLFQSPHKQRELTEKSFSVACYSAYYDWLFPPFPESDKAAHWLLVVGFTVGIPKSDVNDGVSLTFPEQAKFWGFPWRKNLTWRDFWRKYDVIRSRTYTSSYT